PVCFRCSKRARKLSYSWLPGSIDPPSSSVMRTVAYEGDGVTSAITNSKATSIRISASSCSAGLSALLRKIYASQAPLQVHTETFLCALQHDFWVAKAIKI